MGLASDQSHQRVGPVGVGGLPLGVGAAAGRFEDGVGRCLQGGLHPGAGVTGELGIEAEGAVGLGPRAHVAGDVDGVACRLLGLRRVLHRLDSGAGVFQAFHRVLGRRLQQRRLRLGMGARRGGDFPRLGERQPA